MWDTFTVLRDSFDSEIQSIFDIVFSAAFVVPLLFLLLIIIYFLQIHNAKVGLNSKGFFLSQISYPLQTLKDYSCPKFQVNIKYDIMANEIAILKEEKTKYLKEKKNSVPDNSHI